MHTWKQQKTMGTDMGSKKKKKQKANKISKVAAFLKIYLFPRNLIILLSSV